MLSVIGIPPSSQFQDLWREFQSKLAIFTIGQANIHKNDGEHSQLTNQYHSNVDVRNCILLRKVDQDMKHS